MQQDADHAAGQADRHRMAAHTDTDLGSADIHSRMEDPAGLKQLVRYRLQQRLFQREVLPAGVRATADPPQVIGGFLLGDPRVELHSTR
ncbi:hypothetical protein [Actinomadura xylanilytica]|uniref:hypothetical protein n=1 Tax=Actinomadura xylanilytica TaxID=887459 RepID=UPI00255A9BD7|nr:hypothetical protein [Actinomadura xylanilytica]MDL4774256.1 hypothetical protein [Actinomadura xylanilytica]